MSNFTFIKEVSFNCIFEKVIQQKEKRTLFSVTSNTFPIKYRKEDILCSGLIPQIQPKTPIKIEGKLYDYEQNNEKKYIIIVSSVDLFTDDKELLVPYLSTYCNGVGEARARKFLSTGENIEEILKKTPEEIEKETGIYIDIIKDIFKVLKRQRKRIETYKFFSRFEIEKKELKKIISKENIIEKIKENPYFLYMNDDMSFEVSDNIAYSINFPAYRAEREKAIIKKIFEISENQGNTYLDISDFENYTRKIEENSPYKIINNYLYYYMTVVKDKKNYIISKEEGKEKIYSKRLWEMENRIVCNLYRINNSEKELQKVEKIENTGNFSEEQINAVVDMINSPGVKILTGGPGTGKTTTEKLLIRTYEKLYPNNKIVLCAPTGRAAQRMAEATKKPAYTLHKALNIRPDIPNSHVYNMINGVSENPEEETVGADLIIVDEFSMADIYITDILFYSIKSGATVVLVGDVDQLASVGAGNVLHDFLASNKIKHYALTKVFRQALDNSIINNYYCVKNGNYKGLKQDNNFHIITCKDNDSIKKALYAVLKLQTYNSYPKWFKAEYEQYIDLNKDNIQVLIPYKKGDTGINQINKEIQKFNSINKSYKEMGGKKFYVGDKVIMTRNNYELEYFNGDVGMVVGFDRDNITIKFTDKLLSLPFEAEEDIELAYSISIHKSQGSEYKMTIIVLSNEEGTDCLLRRDLLFTAISRAKQKCIIIEKDGCIKQAIENSKRIPALIRKSTLLEKLEENG